MPDVYYDSVSLNMFLDCWVMVCLVDLVSSWRLVMLCDVCMVLWELLQARKAVKLWIYIFIAANIEKTCLWGKISLESLFLSWEKFPNLNKGVRCELLSTVDLVPSILKVCYQFYMLKGHGRRSEGRYFLIILFLLLSSNAAVDMEWLTTRFLGFMYLSFHLS